MSATQAGVNMAVWFEIPATDFGRAVEFYEALFGQTMRQETIGDTRMAVFPYENPGVGGAVVQAANLRPGESGPIVYLNCDGKLDQVIARVSLAGGQLAGPTVDLPGDMGRFIHVRDTEGNRVGLHSR